MTRKAEDPIELITTLQTQLQASLSNQQTLRSLTSELTKLLSSSSSPSLSSSTLISQLTSLQNQHSTQLHSLKLQTHLQTSQLQLTISKLKQENNRLSGDLDHKDSQIQRLKTEIYKLQSELTQQQNVRLKYERMVRNQQQLLQQYRRGIQEQIKLEREILRAGWMQRQAQTRNQYAKALEGIQKGYKQKIKRIQTVNFRKQVRGQVNGILKGIEEYWQIAQKNTNQQNKVRQEAHQIFTIKKKKTKDHKCYSESVENRQNLPRNHFQSSQQDPNGISQQPKAKINSKPSSNNTTKYSTKGISDSETITSKYMHSASTYKVTQ